MKKIITKTGMILMFILILLLTLIRILMSIFDPFYYKKLFKSMNRKIVEQEFAGK